MPTTNSGIKTTADGTSYIPASKRADGTTRKAIRVRPGFTPQEDIETYKSRTAEAWKNRGSGGVPGADVLDQSAVAADSKSKNARRREAVKRRQANEASNEHPSANNDDIASSLEQIDVNGMNHVNRVPEEESLSAPGVRMDTATESDHDIERQKKVRNLLKKLGAVNELKEKKAAGQKLSHDQLMKIGREEELLRDLKKLGYSDAETEQNLTVDADVAK